MEGYENKELDENKEVEVDVGENKENNKFKVDVGEKKELKEHIEIEVDVGENKENKELEVDVGENKENKELEVGVRENKKLKEKKQGFIAKVIEFIVHCLLYLPIGRWLLFIAGCPWCVLAHWLQNKDVVEEVRENKKLEDVPEEENKELTELENKEPKKENIFVGVRENKELLSKMGLQFLCYYNADADDDADDNGNEFKFVNKCAFCIFLNLMILYFFIEFNAYEFVLSPSMCGGICGIWFFYAIPVFYHDPDVLIKALCKAVSVTLHDDQLVKFKRNTKGHRNFYINYTIIISILFGVFGTYVSDWFINVKVVLDCHKINPDNSTGIPCQLEDLIYDGYCCNAVELDYDVGAFFAVIGGIVTSIKGVVYLLASNSIGTVREPGESQFERVRKSTMNSSKEFVNSPRFSRSSRSISRGSSRSISEDVANSPRSPRSPK